MLSAVFENNLSSASTGSKKYAGRVGDASPSIWTHSVTLTGTGAISATVLVEGSNTPDVAASWFTLCTLSPTGTTSATDAITGISATLSVRHRCTAISGTSASATVTSSGA